MANWFIDESGKTKVVPAAILSIVIVAIVIGVTILVTSLMGGDEENIKAELSSDQISEAKTEASEFIREDGTFGIRLDSLSDKNVWEASSVINHDGVDVDRYYVSRSDVYESLRSRILNNSPVSYSTNAVSQWDRLEASKMTGFKINNVSSEVVSDPYFLSQGEGKNTIAVDIKVNFESLQREFQKTADDVSWDGKFNVNEQTYNDSAVLTMTSAGNGWNVYNVKDIQHPFLLATWSNPNISDMSEGYGEFITVEQWQSSAKKLEPSDLPKPTSVPSPNSTYTGSGYPGMKPSSTPSKSDAKPEPANTSSPSPSSSKGSN